MEIIRERLFAEPLKRVYGHAYLITPANFRILSEEKLRRRLAEFFEMLSMLEHAAAITLERVPIAVGENNGGQANGGRMDVLRVMLDAADPLDAVLERLGFSYTIDEPRDELAVTAQGVRDFACAVDGSTLYGRAYTVYGVPAVLPPAWVHDVFDTFHRLQVHVAPVRPDDALRKMENRELLYSGVRTSRADIQKKLRDIRSLKQDLELGNTSAFAFTINGFVFAASRRELYGLHRIVKRNTRAMNIRVTTSLGRQRHIVLGWGPRGWAPCTACTCSTRSCHLTCLGPQTASCLAEIWTRRAPSYTTSTCARTTTSSPRGPPDRASRLRTRYC